MADKAKVRDLLRADGAQEEHRARLHERFRWLVGLALLVLATWAIILSLSNTQRIETQEATQSAAAGLDAEREAAIDAALAEQDAAAAEQAAILAEVLAAQESMGVPVSAADLSAALDGISTTDPALQSALKQIADKVAALEAQAPVPGPPGPTGEPYTGPPPSPGPTGAPGEGYDGPPPDDGSDGQDGETPQVAASLVDGQLVISVTTSAGTESYNVGPVVGPPGPQGEPGPAGPQGDTGSVQPGTYACPAGEYMVALEVYSGGSAQAVCSTLPIGPGNGGGPGNGN